MGERLLCKQEVIGSIPFTSTIALRNAIGNLHGACKTVGSISKSIRVVRLDVLPRIFSAVL